MQIRPYLHKNPQFVNKLLADHASLYLSPLIWTWRIDMTNWKSQEIDSPQNVTLING